MGQNNIEKEIREKLNAREIQPSAQAWDRLDAMLSVAEEKKTRRFPFVSLRFIGIAASVLVFVTLGTFLYNSSQEPKTSDIESVVVNEDNEKGNGVNPNVTEDKSAEILPSEILPQTQQVAGSDHETSHPEKSNQQNQSISNKVANQKTTVHPTNGIQHNQQAIAENTSKKEGSIRRSEEPAQQISQPSQGLIAANQEVAVAQNETASSKVRVNANSLLSEVDGELELTFREKVFKKVSKNYKEVKVALANRNLDQ